MSALDFATVFGISCVVIAIVLVAFSRYRYWLVFMLAGMAFWGVVELLRFAIQYFIEMPLLYGYISAFMLCLLGFTVAIMINDRHYIKNHKKKVNCIEHTPVYENERHPYSG